MPDQDKSREQLLQELTALRERVAELEALTAQNIQQMAAERALMLTLIESLPDYIYAKNREHEFTLVNTATVRHLGAESVEAVLGKTDYDFSPPELVVSYMADEERILNSGQPLLNHEEPILDHETGEQRWVLTTKVPFRNAEGRVVGLVGLNRDITKRKRAEEALRQARDKLEQRVQERTAELTQANAQFQRAHEFLRATLEQLSDSIQHSADYHELLSLIRQAQIQFDRLDSAS